MGRVDNMKRIRPNVVDIAVTYNNEGNQIIMDTQTPESANLLYGLIAYSRNNGTRRFRLGFDYILALAGITEYKEDKRRDYYFINTLIKRTLESVNSFSTVEYKTEKITKKNEMKRKYFPLFKEIEVNKTNKEVMFAFASNDLSEALLSEKTNKYTKFSLFEFMLLEKTNAKTLFRLLAQFQSTGFMKIDVDELKTRFGKESMSTKRFNKEVIEKSIAEINSSNNMIENLTLRKLKEGTKIVQLQFEFTPCKYNNKESKERKLQVYNNQLKDLLIKLSDITDLPASKLYDDLKKITEKDFMGLVEDNTEEEATIRDLLLFQDCKSYREKINDLNTEIKLMSES